MQVPFFLWWNKWVSCVIHEITCSRVSSATLTSEKNSWKLLRDHYVTTDLFTGLSVCCTTPKRKATCTAGSLFWTGGQSVQSLLRADGGNPLWMYSLHWQTLNQVQQRQRCNNLNCLKPVVTLHAGVNNPLFIIVKPCSGQAQWRYWPSAHPLCSLCTLHSWGAAYDLLFSAGHSCS